MGLGGPTIEEYTAMFNENPFRMFKAFFLKHFDTKRVMFKDLQVGMEVITEDDEIGVIVKCDDIHNVEIKFMGEVDGEPIGKGEYCLDPDCKEEADTFIYQIIKKITPQEGEKV